MTDRYPVTITGSTVTMDLATWHRIVDDMDELQDTVDALKVLLAVARGDAELVDFDEDE